MWFRFLVLSSVVFCGVMTTLLVRQVYFPEFDRLPDIDPRHVLERFLETQEVTQVYVYREGEVVGDVSLIPRVLSGSGKATVGFAAAGRVELPNLVAQKLNWRGKLHLDVAPERSVEGFELSVNFSEPPVSVAMELDPRTMAFNYRVKQDGVIVSDSRTDPDAVGVAQAQMLMTAWGMSPEKMEAELKEKQSGLRWVAKQGTVEIAGHRAGAFFIVLSLPSAGELRMTFSEAGELLEVQTPLLYEILSEALRTPPDPLPYNL